MYLFTGGQDFRRGNNAKRARMISGFMVAAYIVAAGVALPEGQII
jgi:hypothetical protein